MICNNCNKEVPDSGDYCPECGAPMGEPIVIRMTKEDIKNTVKKPKKKVDKSTSAGADRPKLKAEGPLFDFSGYVSLLKDDSAKLLGIIGAILLFYSPFMTWLWEELWEKRSKASLFDLGGKNAELALGKHVIIFLALLVLISAIMMIAATAMENIRPLRPYSDNILIKLIPLAVALILFILIMTNGAYSSAYDNINKMIDKAKLIGASQNYSGGRGMGIVLYISGMAVYAVSVLIEIGRKKKNG